MNKLKIIDFETFGNVIKLYLGDINDNEYWGDDWDDRPYEHNAGEVYQGYIKGQIEIAFPSFISVCDPKDDWHYNCNSPFSKEDFKNVKAPCLVIVDNSEEQYYDCCYVEHVGDRSAWQLYYNDTIEEVIQKMQQFGGFIIYKEGI